LLGLDFAHQTEIEKITQRDRMNWEPWVESAPSFAALKERLYKRGYRSTPLSDKAELLKKKKNIKQEAIDRLPQQRTMMRRGSKLR
jgi:hypothetical protein